MEKMRAELFKIKQTRKEEEAQKLAIKRKIDNEIEDREELKRQKREQALRHQQEESEAASLFNLVVGNS
jgi:hypothetical protein